MVSYSFEGNKRFWTARDGEENEKIFSQQSKPTGVKIPHDIKPTYVSNAEYDVEKWPLVHLMRLLRFYAAHRCLWDVSCKDNRNRKMRHAAIVDITAALNIGVSKEQVVQKINILRNTYRYEKKRIKQRIRRGMGASTKLKWFALADAFLRKVPKKGKKQKDPSNSDSDLEDTIVFTINPESMPLEQTFSIPNLQQTYYKEENSLDTNLDVLSEDSHCNSATEHMQPMDTIHDTSTSSSVEFTKREKQNRLIIDNLSQIYDDQNSAKKTWSFDDTIRFLQLLQSHSILLEKSTAASNEIFEKIAKEINHSYKAVKKRWCILQKVCKEEKQKMLQNPQYTPTHKWWPAAEKLIADQKPVFSVEVEEGGKTESIFLPGTENQESSDDDEYENRFLENPIPSVAPLSNMTEALASLFNGKDDCVAFSPASPTNSLSPKDNTSSRVVCNGLVDDLLEGKWSLKHSVKFLRLYGVHKCLWDLNDPDYRSRPLRNAAIEDIAACMGHGLTASYVAKKIKIFRITYMQQRKRLLEANEKGEKPEILLKWFPLADSFLRPHIGLRSIKSDAKEMPQFDYQYVYANLNLIDTELLNDFRENGTQKEIVISGESKFFDCADGQSD